MLVRLAWEAVMGRERPPHPRGSEHCGHSGRVRGHYEALGPGPRLQGGHRAGAGVDAPLCPTPHSVFSGPGESQEAISEDTLQLLFAGKEVQVRVAGTWVSRGRGSPGNQMGAGALSQPHATLGTLMGVEVLG